MTRGILATVRAPLAQDLSEEEALRLYETTYHDAPFVRVLRESLPQTKATLGSNYCDVTVKIDTRTHTVIAIAAIDNLGRGAAGQAIKYESDVSAPGDCRTPLPSRLSLREVPLCLLIECQVRHAVPYSDPDQCYGSSGYWRARAAALAASTGCRVGLWLAHSACEWRTERGSRNCTWARCCVKASR